MGTAVKTRRFSLNDVLWKTWSFIVVNPLGPKGRDFQPLKVEYDENNYRWIVLCRFNRGGVEVKAKVVIDDKTGDIITYEELEG